ncbi:hypothetical protein AB0M90_12440, partial [Micrococcus luteus]|uniref:hypothetical protein n=1 Tax=Micrococcus luteus TaxID=1270 RepID=UPI003438B54B
SAEARGAWRVPDELNSVQESTAGAEVWAAGVRSRGDTEAAVGLGVVLTGDQQERGLRPAEHLADRGQYWRAGA